MRKLVLKNFQSPGDIVMLTAAVRDLHHSYPNQFATDVRTPCPMIWEHNPHLTALNENAHDVEAIDCGYRLIHESDRRPRHFIDGFIEDLNRQLGLNIVSSRFKGDIHLSHDEMSWISQIHELTGENTSFWIIVAGGKNDFTIKWWSRQRYQKVVDHFRGRIAFVQVGEAGHHHEPLDGVIDLRGKTDLRQLIRLVYHSHGVLCPVTSLMHLAAAVPTKPDFPGLRPCVVVAGGREPAHWEAYPGHQLLHTIGMLSCCATGGCWRSRTKPLGDGDQQDNSLCEDVVGDLPHCMDMISSQDVIRKIELYHLGQHKYLSLKRWRAVEPHLTRSGITLADTQQEEDDSVHEGNAVERADEFIQSLGDYPGGYEGRGIVICGGGVRYFTCAWVCVNMLRQHGCQLPVELWHLGPEEIGPEMAKLIEPLGVTCVDAHEVRKQHPVRILNGWELKPFAILHSAFREVLFLDADNVAVRNPEYLFDSRQYQDTGALFWPDRWRLGRDRSIWSYCGVAYRDEPEWESGQIYVDKARCWKALNLCMWYNEYSDFFYHHVHGDKETFHMAFRRLEQPYRMPRKKLHDLEKTLCQHDFDGERIFQHRCEPKWDLNGSNRNIDGFIHEADCFRHLDRLRERWTGRIC